MIMTPFILSQWVLDAYTPGGEKKDVTKSMEALKKLGHKHLKLDEYESKSACAVQNPPNVSHVMHHSVRRRTNRIRSNSS